MDVSSEKIEVLHFLLTGSHLLYYSAANCTGREGAQISMEDLILYCARCLVSPVIPVRVQQLLTQYKVSNKDAMLLLLTEA